MLWRAKVILTVSERSSVIVMVGYVVFDIVRRLPNFHWLSLLTLGFTFVSAVGLGSLIDRIRNRHMVIAGRIEMAQLLVCVIAGATIGAALSVANIGLGMALGILLAIALYSFLIGVGRLAGLTRRSRT